MAVSTNSYFTNSLPSGEMSAGAGINLFREDASPQYVIGLKAQRADGTVCRYCHFGAAVAAGLVVAPDMNESAQAYTANAVIATNSAFQQPNETTGVYPSMLGSKYIVAMIGTKTADQFAGGYITISSGTGLGYTYRIKGNDASSGTSTTIELYDKIKVGLDATADIAIAPSKYANLEASVSGTTQNSLPVAVTVTQITSAGYYGWALTEGITGIAQSGTLVTAKLAVLSDSDAGHVEPYGLGAAASDTGTLLLAKIDAPVIGKIVLATATSGHALIDVSLE